MSGWIFNKGSSFLISGLWRTGPVFSDDTSITARIDFGPKFETTDFTLTVSLEEPRNFGAYASNVQTEDWPVGVHTVRIVRTDADYYENGDPLVEVLDPIQLEVR
jgi:hypothetical protein